MIIEQAAPMNAAQKAWATRRARDAARADIKTISKGIDQPSAAYDPKRPVVDIFLDDNKVGSGLRRYVVLECGPRVVRLFYYPTLTLVKVDRLTFDRKAKPAKDAKKRTIARIIRANVEQAERINKQSGRPVMAEGSAWAKQALAVLR
jgi:hypothetical protein